MNWRLVKDLDLPEFWPYGRLKGQKIENETYEITYFCHYISWTKIPNYMNNLYYISYINIFIKDMTSQCSSATYDSRKNPRKKNKEDFSRQITTSNFKFMQFTNFLDLNISEIFRVGTDFSCKIFDIYSTGLSHIEWIPFLIWEN